MAHVVECCHILEVSVWIQGYSWGKGESRIKTLQSTGEFEEVPQVEVVVRKRTPNKVQGSGSNADQSPSKKLWRGCSKTEVGRSITTKEKRLSDHKTHL